MPSRHPLGRWHWRGLRAAIRRGVDLLLDLRQCEHCGAFFYPARSDQRYCGVSCRKKADYRRKKEGAR